jgi:hypothetical protein
MTRKIYWQIGIYAGIILILFLFFKIAFIKSNTVCGKIIGESTTRGATHYKYKFYVNEKVYFATHPYPYFKDNLTLDSLKKIDCIQIEYSSFSPNISKLVDKRVLK